MVRVVIITCVDLHCKHVFTHTLYTCVLLAVIDHTFLFLLIALFKLVFSFSDYMI